MKMEVNLPASGSGAAAEEKPEAAATTTKKTKTTVVKRLTPEEVARVLAYKAKPRSMLPPERRPKVMSEMLRRHYARIDELIKAADDLVRRSQEDYRRQLDAKGYVEIQVQVDRSDGDDEPQA
ncbi:hypothetical protein ACP4OV_014460 [Aristida adscensionis]